jgi:hypothetical protein
VSKMIRIYATQQRNHKPEAQGREGIVLLRNSGDSDPVLLRSCKSRILKEGYWLHKSSSYIFKYLMTSSVPLFDTSPVSNVIRLKRITLRS